MIKYLATVMWKHTLLIEDITTMTGNPPDPIAAAARRRAEDRLAECMSARPTDAGREDMSVQHELEVHQIELEMQNEELLLAQVRLEELASRYTDLYDHAPVCYFTLDPRGVIVQTNLAGARLLGLERGRIAGKRLGAFVGAADLLVFNAFLRQVFEAHSQPRCEVALTIRHQVVFVVVTATLAPGSQECLLVVIDDTERKLAEDALHDLSRRLLKAEDEERRRIAKELHDSTAQDLVAVMMTLETLREVLMERGDRGAQQLEDSVAILEKCTHDLRTLSYLMHPPRLEEAGLVGAIRYYVEGFGERTGIAVKLELPDDLGRLDQDVELILFRVTQECLGNIRRHAHSPTVGISVARDTFATVLEISDTGCGFPPASERPQDGSFPRLGVGIPAMRERMLQIGGRLEIESSRCGTTVRATLPTMTKGQKNT